MKKLIIAFICVIFLFFTASCENNTNDYFIENKQISLETELLLNNQNLSEIKDVQVFEDLVVVSSFSDNLQTISVYSISTSSLLYNIEIEYSDYYIYKCIIKDDYLVCAAYDQINKYPVIKLHDIKSNTINNVVISNESSLRFYENSIEIDGSYILLNMYDSFSAKTYLTSFDDLETITLLNEYEVTIAVFDSTLEAVFGGKNTLINNSLIMANVNYLQDKGSLDIFDVSNNELLRQFLPDQTCDIFSASLIDSKVALKASCQEEVIAFYIFDILDSDYRYSFNIDGDVHDFKVKFITENNILVSNGNYSQDDGKIYIYNLQQNNLVNIPKPNSQIDYFGSSVYICNDLVIIGSQNEKIFYIYDLTTNNYLALNNDYSVDRLLGYFNNYIIFETISQETSDLYAYNIIENKYVKLLENYPSNTIFYRYCYITDDRLLMIYNKNETIVTAIYNLV